MAAGADRTVLVMSGPHNSNFDFYSTARYERMAELFETIRGEQLPPWPYPTLAEAKPQPQLKDPLITGESDLTVIGESRIRKNRKHEEAREKALRRLCNKPVPAKETDEQYRRRVSLPCKGMLE